MNAKSKALPLLLLAFSLSLGAQALVPLSAFLDGTSIARLSTEGPILSSVIGEAASNAVTRLRHPAFDALKDELRKEKPGILAEALFLLPRPAPDDSSDEMLRIYRQLTAIGSLQGIDYWSESRQVWRTFYAESWRVADATSTERLADEPVEAIPPAKTLYAFQRDLSFGSNTYRYDYHFIRNGAAPAILLVQTNLTRMSYGILPILGAEGLRTRILVIPTREGILFYAVSAANAPPIPILGGKLSDSFSNRAAALFKWFMGRMGLRKN
jgi:hypothetical protein